MQTVIWCYYSIMTRIKKTAKQQERLQLILMFAGAILVFGWAFILAVTTWMTDLPQAISPTNYTDGVLLANLILYSLIVAGAIMLPVGFLYDDKMPREAKAGFTLIGTISLFFMALWVIVFIGIPVHGLEG
jgi:hypothetical protein